MCEVWRVENVKPADRGSGEQKMADTAVCSSIDSGPLEAASSIYQFVSFLILTSAHLPSLSAGSFVGNKQRRSGTPDPWLPGNHTLMWWSGCNFTEASVRTVSRLLLGWSPDKPHNRCRPAHMERAHVETRRNGFKWARNRCVDPHHMFQRQKKQNVGPKVVGPCYYTSCVPVFFETFLSPRLCFYYGRTSSPLPAKDDCGLDNNRHSYSLKRPSLIHRHATWWCGQWLFFF